LVLVLVCLFACLFVCLFVGTLIVCLFVWGVNKLNQKQNKNKNHLFRHEIRVGCGWPVGHELGSTRATFLPQEGGLDVRGRPGRPTTLVSGTKAVMSRHVNFLLDGPCRTGASFA
jgi:hypothetical protein